MEKMNDLKDLLRHEILDLYSAEEQIIDALPLMIEKAQNKDLKGALNNHFKIT
jgi:ferritin-like metal-binding protein YciE